MAAAMTALILLCIGNECRVADGYPMHFGSESDCSEHLNAEYRALVPTDKPEAAVIMICTEGLGIHEGMLLGPAR